eukprot:g3864.t1
MVALAADGYGFFFHRADLANNWSQELLQYLLYMIIGGVSAAITVGALSLNFRPMDELNWRKRSCRSVFALVIVDLMAVDHLQLVIAAMISDLPNGSQVTQFLHFEYLELYFFKERTAKLVGTGFLSIVGLCCTVFFNFIFIKEFGCCLCCQAEKTGLQFVHRAQTWASMKDHPVLPTAQPESLNHEISNSDPTVVQQDFTEVELESVETTGVQITAPVCDENWHERTKSVEINKNTVPVFPKHLERMTTRTLIEIGSVHNTRHHPDPALPRTEITEEPETNPDQSTRRTKKASLGGIDLTQTIQKFLHGGADQTTASLFGFSRSSMRKLWSAVKEEPGQFRYAVWIKSSFFTSVVVLIYACIKSLTIIFSLISQYEENRTRITDHMTKVDECLMDVGWVNGVDSVNRKTAIRLYLLLDRVIMDYKWTAIVGYPLGTAFGLFSLIAVLIQHKQISLAVSNNLNAFQSQSENLERANIQWLEFQKRYPILNACLFLAILSSTAVLQAQIVAGIISFLIGLAVNFRELGVILELYGPYIMVYILVGIIDLILMRILKSSLITDDGYGIKHPRWFNFFMVILSMVHLVLGILYALWRLVYLTMTTVIVLNRLDVSLFTYGEKLDNGHNVFMSMLVLTVLIQQDTEKCRTQEQTGFQESSI